MKAVIRKITWNEEKPIDDLLIIRLFGRFAYQTGKLDKKPNAILE